MPSPFVSVIIPCYNAEGFIEQSIQSIIMQTYKNLEIIVCDDCSTDGTYQILEKLTLEDKRIVLLRNERNLQIVTTLNKMIEIAKGKYIARMDADDLSLSTRIEKQVKFLENNPDYGICGTRAWVIDEKNKIINKSRIPRTNADIQIFKNYDSPFFHPSVMIRTDIMKMYFYNLEYQFCEDFELWQRILKRTKGINLSERLFLYRRVETSICNNSHSQQKQNELRKKLQTGFDVKNIYKLKSLESGAFLYIKLIKDGVLKFSPFPLKNFLFVFEYVISKLDFQFKTCYIKKLLQKV